MTSVITTRITPDLLRGALDSEITEHGLLPHRLPAWARDRIPDAQLEMAEGQPSGVRVVFRTTATWIELDAVPTKRGYRGLPPRPDGVFDLHVDGRFADRRATVGGNTETVDLATGTTERRSGAAGTVRFDGLSGHDKDIAIWLPHNEFVELVSLRTDAPITPATASRPVLLHHGSSIAQGSTAAGPSETYPALAALHLGADLVNLGFSGSALLDPFVARVVRDTPADVIGLEIGINIVNADAMRLRAFVPAVHGFLDTIRDGHPSVPILVLSPIYCPIHENTPGPGAFDPEAFAAGEVRFMATGEPGPGKLTLTVVRAALSTLVDERRVVDANLHYIHGLELYGEADFAEMPLPDRLHPDPESHRSMGRRFAARAAEIQGATRSI